MTPDEEKLTKLFEKYDKESIPGTAYFEALCDFAEDAFDIVKAYGDNLQVKYIHSFISAAYRVGFDRGYKAGREYEQELKKLEKEE